MSSQCQAGHLLFKRMSLCVCVCKGVCVCVPRERESKKTSKCVENTSGQLPEVCEGRFTCMP